jgi:hypothetical protein
MSNETIIAIIAIIGYFLPAIVAWRRGHPQQNPIFIINLFFGWTLIGWVVCLAWSVSAVKKEERTMPQHDVPDTLPRIRQPNALDRFFGDKAPDHIEAPQYPAWENAGRQVRRFFQRG